MSKGPVQSDWAKEIDDGDIDLLNSDHSDEKPEYPKLGNSGGLAEPADDGIPITLDYEEPEAEEMQYFRENQQEPNFNHFESFNGKNSDLASSGMDNSKASQRSRNKKFFVSFGTPGEMESSQVKASGYSRCTFGRDSQVGPLSTTPQQGPPSDPIRLSLSNQIVDNDDIKEDSDEGDDNDRVASFGTTSVQLKNSGEVESDVPVAAVAQTFKSVREEAAQLPAIISEKNKSNRSIELNNSTIAFKYPDEVQPPVQSKVVPTTKANSLTFRNEAPAYQPPVLSSAFAGRFEQEEQAVAQLPSQQHEQSSSSRSPLQNSNASEDQEERLTDITIEIKDEQLLMTLTGTRSSHTHAITDAFLAYLVEYFREEYQVGLPSTSDAIFEKSKTVAREYFQLFFDFAQRSAPHKLLLFMQTPNAKAPETVKAVKQEMQGGWLQQRFQQMTQEVTQRVSQLWSAGKNTGRSAKQDQLYRLLDTLIESCERTKHAREQIQTITRVPILSCPVERSEQIKRAKTMAFLEWLDSLECGQKDLRKMMDEQTSNKNQPKYNFYSKILRSYIQLKAAQITRSKREINAMAPQLITGGR